MTTHSLVMEEPHLPVSDLRDFLREWGGQVMVGILPGVLLPALFLVSPRAFLTLGPTAASLAVLGLVLVVALPLHSYRQFQRLGIDGLEDEPFPTSGDSAQSVAPPRAAAWVQRPSKDERVAALEAVIHRRLGLKAQVAVASGARSARLEVSHLSLNERRRLEVAYANLDLPAFVGLAEVRCSYRRLMYLYHPDRHRGDVVAQVLGEELARRLTIAYCEIVSAFRE